MNRREWMVRAGTAAAALALGRRLGADDGKGARFRIGACDWSLDRSAKVEALAFAKSIGLDGVQVNLGSAGDDMRLRRPEVREEYRRAAKETGVEIASLAIAELNNIPFKSDPRTVPWVAGSIEACRDLGRRVVLLAFFHKNDLRNDPAGVDETVRRLRELAPAAEKAGVVLGIESWLSADEHIAILDRIGSPAVQVYYDVANAATVGHDPAAEIRRLGAARICELHAKENGFLLGEGKVDFPAVRAALDAVGWRGWVQIEGARPKGMELAEAYGRNLKFLRGLLKTD